MKQKLILLATLSLVSFPSIQAGSGKGAAIGIGAGLGGLMLGSAIANSNRPREVVYVQQPAPQYPQYYDEQGYGYNQPMTRQREPREFTSDVPYNPETYDDYYDEDPNW